MQFTQKLLIVFIVIIALVILYRLNRENQEIKQHIQTQIKDLNKKQAKEGFETAQPSISLTPVNEKYMALPLREFIVKSSYNSAIQGGVASKDAIKHVLSRGCRVLDFELYSRANKNSNNTIVYVSQSDDPEYKNVKTDLTLPFADAMNVVAQNAFSTNIPCRTDPLFIHLRIKNNSTESYAYIAKALLSVFDNKLVKGEVMSTTLLSDVKEKVVLILDYTSSPNYKEIADSENLSSLINMYSGTVSLPLYDYQELEVMPPTPISIQKDEFRTDVRSYVMGYPTKMGGIGRFDVKMRPCQMMMTSFDTSNDGLSEYEKFFNKAGYAMAPISTIIRKMMLNNSEQ